MITVLSLSPAVDKIYFVDDFEPGKLFRVRNVVKSAGGKGINVARVAATIGEKVMALGFKAGETGDWLVEKLKGEGVDTEFITVEGESRTNSNIIDRMKNTETELLEIGPFIKPEKIQDFLKIFGDAVGKSEVLVCSGGLPEGVPTDFYSTLISIAKPMGVKVVLDASGRVLAEGIKAAPHIVKPNLRELSRYVDRQLNGIKDIADACREIIAQGVQIVAASMGKDGVLLVSGREALHVKGPEIDVINTIGSGDSMVAGLATGLSRGYGQDKMISLGMACALANTQFVEIGFVSMALVETYLGLVEINKL